MARLEGFEPPTIGLEGHVSSNFEQRESAAKVRLSRKIPQFTAYPLVYKNQAESVS